MLISPPFLPTQNANEMESAWLDRAMREVGDGMYPVGRNLCWHGGVHLEAPMDNGQPLPVRAIADGVVRFHRDATTQNNNPNDPLNYDHNEEGEGGWTSNGVVVIEHETEIGAAENNTPVSVRYFSVYQHLTDIPQSVRVGQRIYRKEEVGRAGLIAGQQNRIHFEIVCDADNLERLIGRQEGDVSADQNGRTDVVFGEIYIRLPVGTPVYTVPQNCRLCNNNPIAHTVAATGAAGTPQALASTTTTAVDCFIGLRYSLGEGVGYQRCGDLTITTYLADGGICGNRLENEGEYNLYSKRNSIGRTEAIIKDYRQLAPTNTGNLRPTPSAVYELLRFGRLINTGYQTLNPADVPHWREIVLPSADGTGTQTGWVNLNNQVAPHTVHVFSDADFPQWRSWKIFGDDLSADDSRCDSVAIKQLLNINSDGNAVPEERRERMQDASVRNKMRHAICSMPCEWNAADLQARWSWLQQETIENPNPLSGEDFNNFIAHAQALCFEYQNLTSATIRFHPRGFIEAFRACLWFKAEELAQIVPRRSIEGGGALAVIQWDTVFERMQMHYIHLDRLIQKYHGSSRRRATYVLAQSILETGYFRTVREGGLGNNKNYDAFYGRGYHQITWAGLYEEYGNYRSFPNQQVPASYTDARITTTSLHRKMDGGALNFQWHTQDMRRYDPEIVASNLSEAAESSGYYWLTKNFRGTSNLNRACDLPLTPPAVGFISWCVNGGGNGYNARQQYTQFIANILMDEPLLSGSVAFQFPPLAANGVTSFPAQTALTLYTGNLTIYYDAQRP
jgi:hydroxyethylthiazole kinase